MADSEKVIKGFECCHVMVHDMGPDKSSCGICPYKDVQTEEQIDLGGIECIAVLHDDARELIREQNQRIWELLIEIEKLKQMAGQEKKTVVELVYDPSIAEEYRREQAEKAAKWE